MLRWHFYGVASFDERTNYTWRFLIYADYYYLKAVWRHKTVEREQNVKRFKWCLFFSDLHCEMYITVARGPNKEEEREKKHHKRLRNLSIYTQLFLFVVHINRLSFTLSAYFNRSRIISTAKYLVQLNSSQLMHSTVEIVVLSAFMKRNTFDDIERGATRNNSTHIHYFIYIYTQFTMTKQSKSGRTEGKEEAAKTSK